MSDRDPTIIRTLKGHRDVITSCAFHPRPSELLRRKQPSNPEQVQIASSSQDGGLMLWNYQSNESEVRVFRFMGHTDAINHICYSPTGRLLASCSSDKSVRLWIPKRSGESVVLKGHNGAVRCVDFGQQDSCQDSLLVTCSDDKTLKLWNLPNTKFKSSLVGHKNWVRSCQFSPDAQFVISGSDDGTMKLWDVNNGDNVVTYKFPSSITSTTLNSSFECTIGIRHVQFHPCGTLFAASGSNGNVNLYDLRSDKVVHSFQESNPHLSLSMGLSFHPGGKHLMTCNTEGALSIWDLRRRSCISTVSMKHTHNECRGDEKTKTFCCNFAPNGMNFVTGDVSKRVCVWKCNLDEEGITTRRRNKDCSRPKQQQSMEDQTRHPVLDRNNVKQHVSSVTNKDPINSTTCRLDSKHHDDDKKYFLKTEEEGDQIISEPISKILNSIIEQLEQVTTTMTGIDKRLSIVEDSMMQQMKKNTKS